MRYLTSTGLALLLLAGSAHATTVNVTFTKLTGITGGSPMGTAVYRASLEGLGLTTVQSVTILDQSGGVGGSPGQFSGFDLDAAVFSYDLIGDASNAGTLTAAGGPNYAGSLFSPGVQRAPVDSKLFGTDATGTHVDNTVATLGAFDGNSTTAIPGADGFLSMGDRGQLAINLGAAISTTGLYLYIGEVGDNGEVAAGQITVSDVPAEVPLPAAAWLFAWGLGAVGLMGRRRKGGNPTH